jgi:histidinol phosphatase-like PHP family hydrolase
MRFVPDHDLHIHTQLSPCSRDARQTPEAILAYGITAGMKLLNLADHCWPDTQAAVLSRPENLPQSKCCMLLHGAEVDMDMHDNLSAPIEAIEQMDFAVIAVNHLHLKNYCVPNDFPEDAQTHKKRFQERVHHLLSLDLPFYKTGLAHFSDGLVCTAEHIKCLDLFTENELIDIFTKVHKVGMGVELNMVSSRFSGHDLDSVLRPLRIAKALGCKFYMGGDAHHPDDFAGTLSKKMNPMIDLLGLEESDKLPFIPETIARIRANHT